MPTPCSWFLRQDSNWLLRVLQWPLCSCFFPREDLRNRPDCASLPWLAVLPHERLHALVGKHGQRYTEKGQVNHVSSGVW